MASEKIVVSLSHLSADPTCHPQLLLRTDHLVDVRHRPRWPSVADLVLADVCVGDDVEPQADLLDAMSFLASLRTQGRSTTDEQTTIERADVHLLVQDNGLEERERVLVMLYPLLGHLAELLHLHTL
jgi:hypothetical protein